MTATISLVVFSLDTLRLGLPVSAVDRVVPACETTPLPGAPASVIGAVNLQGEVIAVLDLRRRLNLMQRSIGIDDHLLIVGVAGRRIAVVVDDVEGASGFPADALVPADDVAPGTPQVQGLIRLDDGLLLIQDPERFLDLDEMRVLDEALLAEAGNGS